MNFGINISVKLNPKKHQKLKIFWEYFFYFKYARIKECLLTVNEDSQYTKRHSLY